jgi:RND superfamily putative drug exporter
MDKQTHSNIAGRMGAWSARHRKTAVLGWLAFVAAALALGVSGGMKMLTGSDTLTHDSARAERLVSSAGLPESAEERVLIQSPNHHVGDPAFTAAIRAVVAGERGQRYVSDVVSPLDEAGAALVSRDGHSAVVQFQVAGDANESMGRVDGPLAAVAQVQAAHPDFRIAEYGGASFGKATMESAGKDFHRAEFLSIPATVIILLLAFGALLAAVLPVVLALTAFAAALGLVLVTSHYFPINMTVFSVMLLIGLAVGVDYSLFYIRREREERAAGRSPEAALQAAAATSGRSVMISGLTVMVAVGGLFLAGTRDFRGVAMGTILVVATSVLGSLTVLPALLSRLGDRISGGRIPLIHRLSGGTGESRFWSAVITRVLRRPLVSAVAATALLVAAAAPIVNLHTIQPGSNDYPSSMPILKTADRLQRAFPGGPQSAEVAVPVADVDARSFATGRRSVPHGGNRDAPGLRADHRAAVEPARRRHLVAPRR